MRASAYMLAFLLGVGWQGSQLYSAEESDKPAATKTEVKAAEPEKTAAEPGKTAAAKEEPTSSEPAKKTNVEPNVSPKAEPKTNVAVEAKPELKTETKAESKPTAQAELDGYAQSVVEFSPDELAIRRNVHEYIAAFESQDAEKLASLWAPHGIWVNGQTGERVEGRAAIQAQFATTFESSEPAGLKVQIQSIHFTTPTVAVEDGTATVTRDGAELKTTAYTAVHVLVDGKWLVDSIRETDLPPARTAQQELSQLDWLVGTWIDESEEATVVTTYHWTPSRNFLVQSFSVLIADQVDLQGTQIIGWDPSQQQIRSWLFDSDGGFAEGKWEAEEDRWLIRQASTLPDGRHGTALHVMSRLDENAFTWKSSAREIDGVMQPNVEEFTIVRQSADEAEVSVEETNVSVEEESTDVTE